jgi:hypothetical protein
MCSAEPHLLQYCPFRRAAYLYVNSLSGCIIDASDDSFRTIFHYLPEQLVGVSVSILFRQADLVQQSINRFAEHSAAIHWQTFAAENESRHDINYSGNHHLFKGCSRQGQTVWFEACIHTISSNTSVWVIRDATELVFASKHNRVVLHVNRYGMIDHIFPPTFLDYSYQDVVNHSLMAFVHEQDVMTLIRGMKMAFESQSSSLRVRWLLKKEGILTPDHAFIAHTSECNSLKEWVWVDMATHISWQDYEQQAEHNMSHCPSSLIVTLKASCTSMTVVHGVGTDVWTPFSDAKEQYILIPLQSCSESIRLQVEKIMGWLEARSYTVYSLYRNGIRSFVYSLNPLFIKYATKHPRYLYYYNVHLNLHRHFNQKTVTRTAYSASL